MPEERRKGRMLGDEDEDEAVLSDAEFCAVVWGDVEYCSGFVVAAGFGE